MKKTYKTNFDTKPTKLTAKNIIQTLISTKKNKENGRRTYLVDEEIECKTKDLVQITSGFVRLDKYVCVFECL